MKIAIPRQYGVAILIASIAILPFLPNQGFGPYEAFNPYLTWLMVVFVSGISLVSYVAVKLLGAKRGIGVTGFFAGLISSTALAFTFSEQSKKNSNIVNPYAFAVVLASSAMFFRVLIEVAVLNIELFYDLVIPIGAMGIAGLVCAVFLWCVKDGKSAKEGMKKRLSGINNPFNIVQALKFGAFFALILFLSKYAIDVFGDRGLYGTAVISAILDVDAITVSVANLAKDGLSNDAGVFAISLAAMTNTVVKGGIFLLFGNKKVALKIIMAFIFMLITGGISLFFV